MAQTAKRSLGPGTPGCLPRGAPGAWSTVATLALPYPISTLLSQVEWERGGEVTEGLADHRPHGMTESGSEQLLCGIYFGDREGANSPPFKENHMGAMILE